MQEGYCRSNELLNRSETSEDKKLKSIPLETQMHYYKNRTNSQQIPLNFFTYVTLNVMLCLMQDQTKEINFSSGDAVE